MVEKKSGERLSGTYRVAALGMLCAAAIVGRIALSSLPSVQPVTAIVILTAAFIGLWEAEAAVFVIVMVTNMILGMGVWTFYQLAAWGIIAALSWVMFRHRRNPVLMLLWAVFAGYGYGAFVSIWSFRTLLGTSAGGYIEYWISGLSVDTCHALSNAVFLWFLLPLFRRFFDKKQTN